MPRTKKALVHDFPLIPGDCTLYKVSTNTTDNRCIKILAMTLLVMLNKVTHFQFEQSPRSDCFGSYAITQYSILLLPSNLRWPRRDITLTKINGTNIIFYYHFHSNFVQTITSIKKYYILLKMNTHFLTKNVQHVFTKPLKTLRAQANARNLGRIFKITHTST